MGPTSEETAMLLVAVSPFTGLLELFVAVPLGIVCSIYGAECAATLRHRHRRHKALARQDDLSHPH